MSTARRLVFAFVCSMLACDGEGQTGAPCKVDDDCNDGLICDVHEGRGSCQEPHGHDEGEGSGEDEAGQMGTACQSDDDCEDGLTCDDHEGTATCQMPHEHESGSDTGEG